MNNLGTRLTRLEQSTTGKRIFHGFIGPNIPGQRTGPDDWDMIELENGLSCFRDNDVYETWCRQNGIVANDGILLRVIYVTA